MVLALRATAGGLLAGHGAQKLFGSFGGHGIEGTAGWLESLGMRPGKPWALMAGASEFGSGMLMSLGLLGPVGPISAFGPMLNAWALAHAGKPIWNTSGGAELPLMFMASAGALALAGPGRFSLDRVLGIKVPAPIAGLAIVGVAAGLAVSLIRREQTAAQEPSPPEQPTQPNAAQDQASEAGGQLSPQHEQLAEREVGDEPSRYFDNRAGEQS